MNKTLIIYHSKYGTTKKVAVSISEKLKGDSSIALFSLKENENPDIQDFDIVILGTSIYMGQASKKMRTFCKTNESALLEKKIGLFACGMHPDKEQQEKELKDAYPKMLQDNAIAVGFFGGAFLFEQMNFLERAIIKKIAKTSTSVQQIDFEAIDQFVAKCQSIGLSDKFKNKSSRKEIF